MQGAAEAGADEESALAEAEDDTGSNPEESTLPTDEDSKDANFGAALEEALESEDTLPGRVESATAEEEAPAAEEEAPAAEEEAPVTDQFVDEGEVAEIVP